LSRHPVNAGGGIEALVRAPDPAFTRDAPQGTDAALDRLRTGAATGADWSAALDGLRRVASDLLQDRFLVEGRVLLVIARAVVGPTDPEELERLPGLGVDADAEAGSSLYGDACGLPLSHEAAVPGADGLSDGPVNAARGRSPGRRYCRRCRPRSGPPRSML
jgi:hypothetical protein